MGLCWPYAIFTAFNIDFPARVQGVLFHYYNSSFRSPLGLFVLFGLSRRRTLARKTCFLKFLLVLRGLSSMTHLQKQGDRMLSYSLSDATEPLLTSHATVDGGQLLGGCVLRVPSVYNYITAPCFSTSKPFPRIFASNPTTGSHLRSDTATVRFSPRKRNYSRPGR